jgi:hypothetical protein
MFGPFWLARHMLRPSRRNRCNQTVQVVSNKQAAKTLFWVTAPLTVPTTLVIGLCLISNGAQAVATWAIWHQSPTTTLVNEWHHPGAGFVAAAVLAVLGTLFAVGIKTTPKPQERRHTCCGMLTSLGHARACHTQRRPPENPARWSDRR